MRVYSGKCEHGLCGVETDLLDARGVSLRVGDIVVTASKDQFGIMNFGGLTVVLHDRPSLYTGGGEKQFFVMGIRNVDINTADDWYVLRVKKWEDVLPGEHWTDYGFNYHAE